jgi:hypothetical protein
VRKLRELEHVIGEVWFVVAIALLVLLALALLAYRLAA